MGCPGGSTVKNPANEEDTRDMGLIPGLGRSPGGGNDSPLQYPCLGNPMDKEAWQAAVHGVTETQQTMRGWMTYWGEDRTGFYKVVCSGSSHIFLQLPVIFPLRRELDNSRNYNMVIRGSCFPLYSWFPHWRTRQKQMVQEQCMKLLAAFLW